MARRRRRARTRTVTRRRSVPSRKKRKANPLQSQWGKISKGAGVLALSQITGTDMSASAGQPIGSRAQNFVNSTW